MTTVKIAFRGDIRRVSVTDYDSLRRHITTAYGIDNFVVKYIDEDDDRISIGSSFELADALRHFEVKGKILKLLVFVPKPVSEEPDQLISKLEQQLLQIQQRVTQRKDEDPTAGEKVDDEVVKKEEPEKKAEVPSPPPAPSAPAAHNVNCAVCSNPILGVLYRCSVCPGVNLCANCEEANTHDEGHTLIKVRVPQAQSRIPQPASRPRPPRGVKKWCRGKFKAIKRAAFPLIVLFVLRTLPFFLALLGLWAAGQFAKKRRHLLSECAECSHSEGCQIGKMTKRAKRCKAFGNKRARIMCKIFFVVGCLLARVMPLWIVLPPLLLAMWCRRRLCQWKKGLRNDFRENASPCHRFQENFHNFVRVCNEMDRALWTQLCNFCQNPPPVGAAVAAAANALGDGPSGDGIQIPVAVPPSGPAFQHQTRLLQEMGFQNTPQLQQLLMKHNGNLQAVITDLMQLNKEKQS